MTTVTTTTIVLKRSDFEEAMLAGDTYDGGYYLVVPAEPSGPADYRIIWHRRQDYWNEPWRDDDYVAKIPALYPDGQGVEYESATELAERILGREEAWRWRDEIEEANESFIEAVKSRWPEQWQASEDDALDFLMDDWLDELNDPATWEGQDEYGMPVRHPHPTFEWGPWER